MLKQFEYLIKIGPSQLIRTLSQACSGLSPDPGWAVSSRRLQWTLRHELNPSRSGKGPRKFWNGSSQQWRIHGSRICTDIGGKRPYYAHLTGKRILWPNYWLHGDQTLAGYRLDNCLSIPKYKSVLSLQQFRQYRFSGGSAFVRNREQMPQ